MSSSGQTGVFVVKVASRCNLACTYCYMYTHVDQSWKNQPKFISKATVKKFASRLEEYVNTYKRKVVMIVLHGGEPLLYPELDFFLQEIKSTVKSCKVTFSIQTNGTLLNIENLTILKKYNVHIGISVDGNRKTHNRLRIKHDGTGSYEEVHKGITLARVQAEYLFDSVLQVIDTSVSPTELLDILESYKIKGADLLFPDLNHDTILKSNLTPGKAGNWLTKVFDEWVSRRETIQIRLFMKLIYLLLGGHNGTEQLGARSVGALMIETDGKYDIYDALKTSYPGAGHTGLNVQNTSISEVERLPLAVAFRDKATAAAGECLRCNLFNICGGGNLIHRYGKKNKFNQPTVYCEDMKILINHIKNYLLIVDPDLKIMVNN